MPNNSAPMICDSSLPITPKENWLRAIHREKPLWMPTYDEVQTFVPDVIPDNVVRGMIFEKNTRFPDQGGLDMFGIEWEYVPAVHGAMEKPGPRLFDDVNEWKEKVVFPDVDSWDWEGSAKRNEGWFDPNRIVQCWMYTNFFERLISFMGFEDALLAMIDEDQRDALVELMDKLADLDIEIIDHLTRYYPIDALYFHDDWGSQASTLFSYDACHDVLLPPLKKVVDFAHSKGLYFEMHSCGKIQPFAPILIEAGVDVWCGQPMNDKFALREKYGDKLLIGINPPESDVATANGFADEILEKVKDDFQEKPMYYQVIMGDPAITAHVREEFMKLYA